MCVEYAWLDMIGNVVEAVIGGRVELVLSLKGSEQRLMGFERSLDAGHQRARNAAAWILVLSHLNTLERTESPRRTPTRRVLPSVFQTMYSPAVEYGMTHQRL